MDIPLLMRAVVPVLAVSLLAACSGAVARQSRPPSAATAMPHEARAAGLVDVRDFVPGVDLDIRYATEHNFVGSVVTGYEAPLCWLHRPVAEALAKVAACLLYTSPSPRD